MYEVGLYEVGLYEVGLYEVGLYEVGLYEVGLYEVGHCVTCSTKHKFPSVNVNYFNDKAYTQCFIPI